MAVRFRVAIAFVKQRSALGRRYAFVNAPIRVPTSVITTN